MTTKNSGTISLTPMNSKTEFSLENFINSSRNQPVPDTDAGIQKLANDYADLLKHSEILVDSMFNDNHRKTPGKDLIQSYHNVLTHIKQGSK